MTDFIAFALANNDPDNVGALSGLINAAATAAKIPACGLAAIVSRESNGQNIFQYGMPRANGCGVGLTQITAGVDWTDPSDPLYHGYHLMDESDNLHVSAAFFIAPLMASAARLQLANPAAFAQFGGGEPLYYVFAGYNAGWGNVMKALNAGNDPDSTTTHGYATDTLRRYNHYVAASHQVVAAASQAAGL